MTVGSQVITISDPTLRNVSTIYDAMRGDGEGRRPVDDWFMMSSPWPVLCLAALYLCFVLRLGPQLMGSKPPYSLRSLILIYNLLQVIFSSWFVLKVVKNHYGTLFEGACTPAILSRQSLYEMDSLSWYYLMSKLVEMLDTIKFVLSECASKSSPDTCEYYTSLTYNSMCKALKEKIEPWYGYFNGSTMPLHCPPFPKIFFVLRRKMKQVTFLHVYHHTNMALSTWAFIKYMWGSQFIVIGLCNTFVHILMYSYYLLSSLGPQVQKFLWWKKYITQFQIVQFLIIISFLMRLMLQQSCQIPWGYLGFALANTTSFLVLFTIYYINSYNKQHLKQTDH